MMKVDPNATIPSSKPIQILVGDTDDKETGVVVTTVRSSGQDLEVRAKKIGADLRASLEKIVTRIGGPAPRPIAFATAVGIDKSLASKVVRAIKESNPLTVLHASPAPRGLQMLVDAAERRGVPGDLCLVARESIGAFQILIDEFDGGRAEFEVAIDSLIPGASDSGMRRASQSAYKSMSYLLGFRSDVSFSTSFINPSANGNRCDDLHIGGLLGLRRLGKAAPITLMGGGLESTGPVTPESVSWETLGGEQMGKDFKKIVLSDFCSDGLPELEVFPTHTQRRLQLPEGGLPLNQPIDIVHSLVIRNAHLRQKTAPENFLAEYKIQRPCRVMVMDVFLHDDVCPGAAQEIVTRTWTPGPPLPIFTREDMAIDSVEVPLECAEFPRGLANVGISDIPHYEQMIDSVLEKVGWDRSRFRGFRIRCQYPLPLVMYGQLFELPDPPAGG